MTAIQFKPGPQIAGTEVIDINGVHWTVLKNISYATAQPREGAYYTKVLAPVEPPFDYKAAYQELLKRISSDVFNFDPRDFVIDATTKMIRIRR